MAVKDPNALLDRLLDEPTEREWLEFKHNNWNPEEIGKCVSACANAAMVAEKDRAFIVWGIENGTKRRLGTEVRLTEKNAGRLFQPSIGRYANSRFQRDEAADPVIMGDSAASDSAHNQHREGDAGGGI